MSITSLLTWVICRSSFFIRFACFAFVSLLLSFHIHITFVLLVFVSFTSFSFYFCSSTSFALLIPHYFPQFLFSSFRVTYFAYVSFLLLSFVRFFCAFVLLLSLSFHFFCFRSASFNFVRPHVLPLLVPMFCFCFTSFAFASLIFLSFAHFCCFRTTCFRWP